MRLAIEPLTTSAATWNLNRYHRGGGNSQGREAHLAGELHFARAVQTTRGFVSKEKIIC